MKTKALVSVVVPVFDEEAVLETFHARMARVFDGLPELGLELVFVNDGSRDGSLKVLQRLCTADPRVGLVNLSRNFGKEIAMTAGLDHCSGDAVVVIDADLQDPPEVIPDLIAAWKAGHDVVYARRSHRDGESWLKRGTAHAFYRLMLRASQVPIPPDTGDFRLMSRRAVDALLRLRERHRFMKGLFAWVGYPTTAVVYRRDPRAAGHTKFNYWRLWNFALEGLTSFSTVPLRVATYLGVLVSLGAFLWGCLIVVKTLLWGDPVPGYPSLMVAVLFLGGVQLMAIGMLGEYVGRIFGEVKARPLYLVEAWHAPSQALGQAAGQAAGQVLGPSVVTAAERLRA